MYVIRVSYNETRLLFLYIPNTVQYVSGMRNVIMLKKRLPNERRFLYNYFTLTRKVNRGEIIVSLYVVILSRYQRVKKHLIKIHYAND